MSAGLSLVFLTSAWAKTRAFPELESTLAASKLVPVVWVPLTGTFLLVLEYLLSLLLLFPATRRPALLAATGLVSLFVAYTLWRWMQGISVPCHCFGVLFKLEPWQSLSLNGVLLYVLASLLTTPSPPKATQPTHGSKVRVEGEI